MSTLEHPFRVIVVGAGIAGLTASHCLQNAGIEHVVFERRSEIALPEGASIAIYPHGARILHQIGCLDAVKHACTPCDRWFSRRPDGKAIMNNGFFHHVKQKYGMPCCFNECLYLLFDFLAIIPLARDMRKLWLALILILIVMATTFFSLRDGYFFRFCTTASRTRPAYKRVDLLEK